MFLFSGLVLAESPTLYLKYGESRTTSPEEWKVEEFLPPRKTDEYGTIILYDVSNPSETYTISLHREAYEHFYSLYLQLSDPENKLVEVDVNGAPLMTFRHDGSLLLKISMTNQILKVTLNGSRKVVTKPFNKELDLETSVSWITDPFYTPAPPRQPLQNNDGASLADYLPLRHCFGQARRIAGSVRVPSFRFAKQ